MNTKAVPKVTGHRFCTPIIFKNPIKLGFLLIIIQFIFCVRIATEYFLSEKGFNELFKDISNKVYKYTNDLKNKTFVVNTLYLHDCNLIIDPTNRVSTHRETL